MICSPECRSAVQSLRNENRVDPDETTSEATLARRALAIRQPFPPRSPEMTRLVDLTDGNRPVLTTHLYGMQLATRELVHSANSREEARARARLVAAQLELMAEIEEYLGSPDSAQV